MMYDSRFARENSGLDNRKKHRSMEIARVLQVLSEKLDAGKLD